MPMPQAHTHGSSRTTRVPLLCRQDLRPPLGDAFARIFGRWPAVVAFGNVEQALHTGQRSRPWLWSCKPVGHSGMLCLEPAGQAPASSNSEFA
jgi:hypothetical protein